MAAPQPLIAKTIVVDSGGIINAVALAGKAEKYVTIPEVFEEIKDEQSRQRLQQLPYDLEVRQPSETALAAVTTYARTTGDLKFLSKVDIHVLALTYMVEAEERGWADVAEEVSSRLGKITARAAKIQLPGADVAAGSEPAPKEATATAAVPQPAPVKTPWGGRSTTAKPSFAQLLASQKTEEDTVSGVVRHAAGAGAAAAGADADDEASGRGVRFAAPERPKAAVGGHFPALGSSGTAAAAAGGSRSASASQRPKHGTEAWYVGDQNGRAIGTSILSLVAQDTARAAVASAVAEIAQRYPDRSAEAEESEESEDEGDTDTHKGPHRSHILSHGVSQAGVVRHVKATEDDGPAWISPTNFQEAVSSGSTFGVGRSTGAKVDTVSASACVTVDFTMQNVLLGMGIRVLGAAGRRVKRVKQFVLKCDSCYNVTRQMDRLFCERCGHATLARLGVTVDGKGRTHYHYAKNRRVNTRGQRYALGKPTGGRTGGLLLSEDQLLQGAWASRTRQKDKHHGMWADGRDLMSASSSKSSGFGDGWAKPTAGAAQTAPRGLGVRGNKNVVVGIKGNPNEKKGRERRGAKKKNKRR